LRRWQLNNTHPIALTIAADARLTETNYLDDQSWRLQLGSGDEAALAFQTQYGGRAGLVSLVPMWTIGRRILFEAQAYHEAPSVISFAPGYLRVSAIPIPNLIIEFEFWVAASHAVTGSYRLTNTSDESLSIRADLYTHAIVQRQEVQVAVLTLASEETALYLGKLANIDPVVMVEGGTMGVGADGHLAPKVGQDINVPPGETVVLRWAHAALGGKANSIRSARHWFSQDIDAAREAIETGDSVLPHITTGNTNQDAAIAFAVQQAASALMSPTEDANYPTFVAGREPLTGYSASGDGSDYLRTWRGQPSPTAYLLTQALASAAPQAAEGILRNYAVNADEDGFIPWAPGAGGGGRDDLALPILARMAWRIYNHTHNRDFIEAVFPALHNFFLRWFATDADRDGDGVPEWTDVAQTGYAGWPQFTGGGVDISTVEGPGLIAYLLSEAHHLAQMAFLLEDADAEANIQARIEELDAVLSEMWDGEAFTYRDRDTHITTSRQSILDGARADEPQLVAFTPEAPSRVVIEPVGGASNKPSFSVTISGQDADGDALTETLDADAFLWTYGRGSATTRGVFSVVDTIEAEGLSRVFRLNAHTTGLVSNDVHTLLPLITGALTDGQVAQLVEQLKASLLQPNGISMYPTPDAPNEEESGVWVFWNTLICEALFVSGYGELATDILRRLLRVQTATLREHGVFTTFYDQNDARGMGTRLDLSGIVPVHLLMMSFGLHIRADGTVIVGEGFAWGDAVSVTQMGIQIERNTEETSVTFPDGASQKVQKGRAATIHPPEGFKRPSLSLSLPAEPAIQPTTPSKTPIQIEVEIEPDSSETPQTPPPDNPSTT